MARDNKGLKTPIPNKSSFVYGTTGERAPEGTKVVKGGDLRAKPSKNAGK
jgi:hypothetical protein